MFIVWGSKHVYRKVGYVADFCPMCRGVRGFLLRRVGLAGHIYYISVSEGDLVGHQRTCEECHTTYQADVHKYAAFSKKAESLDDLQQQTYPALHTALAERLALEEKVKNTPAFLSADEREGLLYAPFALLSPKVEEQYASLHIDKTTGLSLLGAFILLLIVPGMIRSIAPDHAEEAMLTFFVVGLLFIGWQFAMSGRRFMRDQIIPVLAKALRPLHPTELEMRAILDEFRKEKHKIGKKLKLAELVAHLQNLRTTR